MNRERDESIITDALIHKTTEYYPAKNMVIAYNEEKKILLYLDSDYRSMLDKAYKSRELVDHKMDVYSELMLLDMYYSNHYISDETYKIVSEKIFNR